MKKIHKKELEYYLKKINFFLPYLRFEVERMIKIKKEAQSFVYGLDDQTIKEIRQNEQVLKAEKELNEIFKLFKNL